MMDDWPQLLRLLAALLFVIGLMGGMAYVMRRFGLGQLPESTKKTSRLKIIETTPLDARRRLVLLRRDNKEHLVILSANGETVIETGITPPKEKETAA